MGFEKLESWMSIPLSLSLQLTVVALWESLGQCVQLRHAPLKALPVEHLAALWLH